MKEKRRDSKGRIPVSYTHLIYFYWYALVAQLDRVTGYEPVGRGFESLPAYQKRVMFFRMFLVFIKMCIRDRC